MNIVNVYIDDDGYMVGEVVDSQLDNIDVELCDDDYVYHDLYYWITN